MNSGKRLRLPQILSSTFLAIGNFGCGGCSSSQTFPPPTQISVALSPMTATVQSSLTARLTATVSGDASNSGVSWTVSCSAVQCGTITPLTTPSGAPAIYTAPATMPANVNVTVTATSVADKTKASSSTLIPVGYIPGYDVGVDYHADGLDIDTTGFIAVYNQPQVRQTVQEQVQGMADRGATFIHTSIWVAKPPGTNCCSTAEVTFSPTDQEMANLRAYVQDVAAVVGAQGTRLRLDLALMWTGGAADFTIGSPATGLGSPAISAADFVSRVQSTIDTVLAAVSDVTRPDGVRVVDTIFFAPELLIPGPGETDGNPNEGWFLTTSYPYFVSVVSAKGIRPSVYFWADGNEADVDDSTYVDSLYPILNGRRSMFWVYRSMKFMADNGLPLPSRIDFSCYLDSTGATYDQLLQHVLDDADATLPSLGAPRLYGAAETYYLADTNLRLQYGQAFAAEAAQNPRLQRVSFWTTPGGGPNMEEQNSAYPFTIEDFLPFAP
jgi:hypothetical protein